MHIQLIIEIDACLNKVDLYMIYPTTRENYHDKEKFYSNGGEYKEIGVLPPEMVYTSIGLKRHYTAISKEKVKIIHCPKLRTSGSSY
jgi:hypothetical protein